MREVFVRNKKELWQWLAKNYNQSESIWLVYYKKSSNKSDLTVDTIIDYCLCFGWIDSVVGKVDEERTKVRISPRSPKSKWSKVNKVKVKKLMSLDMIQPSGKAVIDLAKKNGTWNALDEAEKLILPKDLEHELIKKSLFDSWSKFSRSNKRMNLELLINSKRGETRKKRIQEIVQKLKSKN